MADGIGPGQGNREIGEGTFPIIAARVRSSTERAHRRCRRWLLATGQRPGLPGVDQPANERDLPGRRTDVARNHQIVIPGQVDEGREVFWFEFEEMDAARHRRMFGSQRGRRAGRMQDGCVGQLALAGWRLQHQNPSPILGNALLSASGGRSSLRR